MSGADYGLTEGCLTAILNGVEVKDPVVQILEHKPIAAGNRYRLNLNDGRNNFTFATTGSQLSPRLAAGEFPMFSTVRLDKFTRSDQGGRGVLVILGLTLMSPGGQNGLTGKLGNPVPATADDAHANAGQQAPASAGAARPQQSGNANGFGAPNQTGGNNQFGGGGFGNGQQQQGGFKQQSGGNQTGGFGGNQQQQNGFGGNQQAPGGGGNFNANGNRPQTNGSGNKNANPNFSGGPAQKRPNLGPNSNAAPGNQWRANSDNNSMTVPNGAQGNFRPQNPTYPQFTNQTGGGNGASYGQSSTDDSRGFGENDPVPDVIVPIGVLNPYQNNTGNFTIRVRVKSKDPIRNWTNAKGNGTVFGMWVQDDSDEMKCSAFTNEVTKFYDQLHVDKWYYLRGVKVIDCKDPRFSRGKKYELQLTSGTQLRECTESLDAPKIQFQFTTIENVRDKLPDHIVDVIGLCSNIGEVTSFQSKAGKDFTKREIELRDVSNYSVRVTLWGNSAENFTANVDDVVAIKGCKVSDFGGRTLSGIGGCDVVVNPDITQAHTLKGWLQGPGQTAAATSISTGGGGGGSGPQAPFENLLMAESRGSQVPEYFEMKGTVMRVENAGKAIYPGCPRLRPNASGKEVSCNKKVIDSGNGVYRCETCQADNTTFKWRLMPQLEIADFGGCVKFVSAFQEQAEAMLGGNITSQELGALSLTEATEFQKILCSIQFKSFIFKLRVGMDNYLDAQRKKYGVVSVRPLDMVEHSKRLAEAFKQLMSG